MKILFSIPVHENPEVIADQISNFRYFNPDCGIILHLSKSFSYGNYDTNTFTELVKSFPDTFINPVSLRTGWLDIIQTHLSNYEYAVQSGLDFEYFALAASNELFVRPGLYQMMNCYTAGSERGAIDLARGISVTYRAARDESLIEMVKANGGKVPANFVNSQVEGSFFSRDAFAKIHFEITKFFDYQNVHELYPREEVYFATLAYLMIDNKKILNDNYTFFNKKSPIIAVHLDDLDDLCEGDTKKYSVKRINRDFDDPMRFYIRNHIGQYNDELLNRSIVQKEYTLPQIRDYDNDVRLAENKERNIRKFKNSLRQIRFVRDFIDKDKYMI